MKKRFLYGLICLVIAIIHSGALMAQIKTTKKGEIDFSTSKSSITWQNINNNLSFKTNISLDYTTGISNELTFSVNAYKLKELQVNKQKMVAPELEDATYILKKGAPELPKYVKSLIIPDLEEMHIEVISASYIEVKNIEIAPSKGNLPRNIDPKRVPYVYGEEYKTDEYFPGTIAELGSPYILREYRGQTVVTYPLQYNPIQKTLRIYTEIKVRVSSTGKKSTFNVLARKSTEHSSEFENIYKDHFINYNTGMSTYYTPLDDTPGNMLIICYGDFMDEMADFVAWKKQKGIPVEMVNVSTIGSSSQIKTYVANYYNTNGLTYLLLVGDNAQVPSSSTSAGASDNNYGYIVGDDHYCDVLVGRFSAETGAQVTTMADRTIHYERDVTTTETWMENAIGSASAEGDASTGDDAESDAEHINNIETDLNNYGYTVTRVYESGGTVTQMSNAINAGTGLINYCGHGSETSWVNVAFGTTQVNALTNNNKLPFIMDVACVNGAFASTTCFAEAWLRATNNNEPTGAIGIYGSTINQDWAPPMRAQDEFVDILVESYTNNIKRTFAGAAMNGIFDMIGNYSTSGNNMADTWTLFGDPSFVMRTKQPTSLTVSHSSTISATASTFTVDCSTDGALVSLTSNDEIIGTKTVSSGTANVDITGLPTSGTMTVTVTAYNKTVYTADVSITGGGVVKPVADFSGTPTTVSAGNSVQFTDLSTNSPTSWAWVFEGGTPSTSSSKNPSVTYSTTGTYPVTLTATNSAGSDTMTKTGYITVDEAALTYCSSGGSNYSYEWISNVGIGSFSHASSAASYTDFTSYTIELSQGQAATVNLTPGFSSSSYTEYWEIWIDYNKDGDFEDSGENVFSGSGTSAVSGSFTVSEIAVTTRMRIAMKYNSVPTSCETFSYGEVEDYTVNIASLTSLPPVAQLSASATALTVGQSITFTDQTTNSPTSWSWSFEGGEPSTSTVQNPTVTYSTAGTYQVTLTASNSVGSDTETKTGYITVSSDVLDYCSSQGNNYNYEYISNVQIGSFSKSSTGSNYSDFTGTIIDLSTGSNSIALTPYFSGSSYTEYWKVWIDYNKDGDFEDSGEEVFSPSGSSSAVSGSFTPPTTFSGQARMRITMKYNSSPTSCETFSYGEVEDYTVSVARSAQGSDRSITFANNDNSSSTFSIYPNPVKENLYIQTEDIHAEIKIINAVGSIAESTTLNGGSHVIDVSAFPVGVYTIIINVNGKTMVNKFIKQ